MAKKALVTGVTGQDGSYLAKLLLEKGYEVYGGYRRNASTNTWRSRDLGLKIGKDIKMVPLELLEYQNIQRLLKDIQPDEIYNLAAQSFVAISFEQPLYTADADGVAVCRFLEAMREVSPHSKFYQASTSEMFGKVQQVPQTEATPFYPRSPYGVAKLYGHWIVVNYREGYGMHASSGILFNHESPLRGIEFVTRKVTAHLAEIKHGHRDILELGNIDAKRDWGFAGDYVEGMYMMLQQEEAGDYVLGSNQTQTVRDFINHAAPYFDMDLAWDGEADKEKATDRKTGRVVVQINPTFYRPAEVDLLIGDAAKAKAKLGWKPKTTFSQLVEMMAKADYDRAALGPIEN
ncbi:MAG: GDP-mannose 4,6-dehydratase [Armatimonadota bacterium]